MGAFDNAAATGLRAASVLTQASARLAWPPVRVIAPPAAVFHGIWGAIVARSRRRDAPDAVDGGVGAEVDLVEPIAYVGRVGAARASVAEAELAASASVHGHRFEVSSAVMGRPWRWAASPWGAAALARSCRCQCRRSSRILQRAKYHKLLHSWPRFQETGPPWGLEDAGSRKEGSPASFEASVHVAHMDRSRP